MLIQHSCNTTYPRNMDCCGYIIEYTLHKGNNKYKNNNSKNEEEKEVVHKYWVPLPASPMPRVSQNYLTRPPPTMTANQITREDQINVDSNSNNIAGTSTGPNRPGIAVLRLRWSGMWHYEVGAYGATSKMSHIRTTHYYCTLFCRLPDSKYQISMSVAASMRLNVVLLGCAACGVFSSVLLIYGIYRVSHQRLTSSELFNNAVADICGT
jgi:hypothetical protein